MHTFQTQTIAKGLAFPEGPRWYAGRLWFTDQHGRAIYAMNPAGELERISTTDDLPGGLCWLPDGTLLVVYMTQRRLMRLSGSVLEEYADLSGCASYHCNDMVADRQGRVYVGNFGFDLHGGAAVSTAEIVRVDTDGEVDIFCGDVVFPNGGVITPDGQTLLIAETFAHRITAFQFDAKGGINERALWADLGEATPDGICLDEDNALWVASPGTKALLRVKQGGEILARCETSGTPYACMLGGVERRILYVCTSETDNPGDAARLKSGRIEQVRVVSAGAGLP